MQIITKNRKNASFLSKNYLQLLLKQLSNTAETKPKTVDGNKEAYKLGFRNIQNDKRSKSNFHEKYFFSKAKC